MVYIYNVACKVKASDFTCTEHKVANPPSGASQNNKVSTCTGTTNFGLVMKKFSALPVTDNLWNIYCNKCIFQQHIKGIDHGTGHNWKNARRT